MTQAPRHSGQLAAAKGLGKFYGPRLVFKDVQFTLHAGECLLLAGPNGAGKSTLLKILAGLTPADAGVCDLTVGHDRLGFLGHVTCIYPQMSGLENLRFWARVHGLSLDDEVLRARLAAVNLADAADDRAGAYSRGMAQRLNLARVFLNEPDLLLLDEPGTGLDVASSAMLTRSIRQARERGAGVIWISHHLERDLPEANAVLALSGRGAPAYHGPAAGYTPEACTC
ncbi:ABC transporter ATP-binding protein [Megalodesulfovibrio gigas]|uniref:Putative heme exporter protein CcmA n=1 Tax=Megalodesulfovibrio gigas (strain ATCC 19364 / DSM 1382 / NCIMB 9332 / VKM B-1759) TaxID=1121448 RepID=T2GDH7_MEGG1|nr:ABC transporter ATP-binding protein [Megalodesulfovibrio gigas]AGW13967.1 putative heme exporter protein CcmA [Megalodesulfovibrio gigas DSM 1382 = ATCC 19364]